MNINVEELYWKQARVALPAAQATLGSTQTSVQVCPCLLFPGVSVKEKFPIISKSKRKLNMMTVVTALFLLSWFGQIRGFFRTHLAAMASITCTLFKY